MFSEGTDAFVWSIVNEYGTSKRLMEMV